MPEILTSSIFLIHLKQVANVYSSLTQFLPLEEAANDLAEF